MSPKLVLVVEDVPDLLYFLTLAIEEENHRVEGVRSVKLAIEKLEQSIPQLIVLDLMMPEQDGYDLIKYVKSNPKLSHIPILVLTGLTPAEAHRAIVLGATDWMQKPVDVDALVSQVQKLLEKSV